MNKQYKLLAPKGLVIDGLSKLRLDNKQMIIYRANQLRPFFLGEIAFAQYEKTGLFIIGSNNAASIEQLKKFFNLV